MSGRVWGDKKRTRKPLPGKPGGATGPPNDSNDIVWALIDLVREAEILLNAPFEDPATYKARLRNWNADVALYFQESRDQDAKH